MHLKILRIGDRELKPMVNAQPQAYAFFWVLVAAESYEHVDRYTDIIHDTCETSVLQSVSNTDQVRFKVSHGFIAFCRFPTSNVGGSSLRPGNESHGLCLVLSEGPGRRNSMQGTKTLCGA